MSPFLITIFSMLLIFSPSTLHAHGVSGRYQAGGVTVVAEYSDGSPVSYAETEILPPDSETPFVSGWTDRNGRFAFFPDVKGTYKAVINDGMGHQLEIAVPVDESGLLTPSPQGPSQTLENNALSRTEAIIRGLTLLFFIFGCLFWYKGRKKSGP